MKSKDTGFMLLMFVLTAAVVGLAYVFLIGPAIASKSEAEERHEAAIAFNDTLEIQLKQYQKDFEELPAVKAEIAEIRQELAPQEDVAAVRNEIDKILVDESLTKASDSTSIPLSVVPGTVILQPAAQFVGRVSYTDTLMFQNLYATQIDVQVQGQYTNIVRAIAKMQMTEDRYLLVRNVTIEVVPDEAEGTYNASFEIIFYTLVDTVAPVDPGTNSDNIDPVTGEVRPDVEPGDALKPIIPWATE